jgi:hypothetical protein
VTIDKQQIKLATKLVYDYKYKNETLESTIKSLLTIVGISSQCLTNKAKEDKVLELGQKLSDYKFHKSSLSSDKLSVEILEWLTLNKLFLDVVRLSFRKSDDHDDGD